MVLSLNEIKEAVKPIAIKYQLKAVYLFGSYARNAATDDSDVDFLIDRTDSKVKSMFDMGGLYNDLSQSIGKSIDIVTTNTIEQQSTIERTPDFVKNIILERIKIYE